MKNNPIVLFFTNKFYRWSRIQYFKLKMTDLPIIKEIVIGNETRKFYKKTKDMTNWDRYCEIKSIEANNNKLHFIATLLTLRTSILTADKTQFEKAKNDVLSSKLIMELQFSKFKSWLENVDVYENDTSKIDEVLSLYTGIELKENHA